MLKIFDHTLELTSFILWLRGAKEGLSLEKFLNNVNAIMHFIQIEYRNRLQIT